MSVRARLLLLVAGLILLALATPALMVLSGSKMLSQQEVITRQSFAAIRDAGALRQQVAKLDALVAGTLAMTGLPDIDRITRDFTRAIADVEGSTEALEQEAETPEMIAAVTVIATARTEWENDARMLLGLTPAREIPTGELMARRSTTLLSAIARLESVALAEGPVRIAAAQAEFTKVLAVELGAGLILLALAAGIAARTTTRLIGDLRNIGQTMQELSEGRFDRQVQVPRRRDEIGAMAGTLTVFRAALQERSLLEERRREASAEAEQAATRREELIRRIGAVVESGRHGDFSARVPMAGLDPAQVKLAEGVNNLLDIVESGVGATVGMLTALADADLSHRMEGQFEGAFARLSVAANETAARLTDLVDGIQRASDQAQSAAADITSTASELSGRVESQAMTLHQTRDTMAGLAATVRSNAEALAGADRLAGELAQLIRQGSATVENSVQAVSRIETSSNRISEIITVIQSIAFQTNLLALNAAVEAARAGDAGKGFAVVASEVRTLAQRSAQAAADITGLIRESAATVEEGVGLVRATGDSLGKIEQATDRLVGTIGSVTEAGKRQAADIQEVGNGISHITALTEANAGVVESSVTIAATLTEGLADLEKLVSVFRSAQDGTAGHRRRAA